jgi:hypothetical protein
LVLPQLWYCSLYLSLILWSGTLERALLRNRVILLSESKSCPWSECRQLRKGHHRNHSSSYTGWSWPSLHWTFFLTYLLATRHSILVQIHWIIF